MEKLEQKKQVMLSSVPREILGYILESCEKLKDVENCCEAEDITLNQYELDSLSRKFKLPFYTERRLALGKKNRGLSYLLRCQRLCVQELIFEFLSEDDPRVLEYFSVNMVVYSLFPYHQSSNSSWQTFDCPVIVLELLKLEEWNTLFSEITVSYREYPLVSCVQYNSFEMMKVLVEDGRIVLKNASLDAAISFERLHIVEFLLSKSPPHDNWDGLVSRAHAAKNRAIFNLFLLDKSGNTCNWNKFFLDSIKRGDIERVRNMLEHNKVETLIRGTHPLLTAVKVNQLEVIQFLLLRQETTDESINRAFKPAVHSKSLEAVTILLESGRVNKDKVRTLKDELSRAPKIVLYDKLDKYCSAEI